MFNIVKVLDPDKASNILKIKKNWRDCGNGVEVLTTSISDKENKKEEEKEGEFVEANKDLSQIQKDILVFFKDAWRTIGEIKEDKATLIVNEEKIEEPISSLRITIPIKVLILHRQANEILIMEVYGSTSLQALGVQIKKMLHLSIEKAEWIYKNEKITGSSTIEHLKLAPNDTLTFLAIGYDIQTFKRFPRIDEGRGWYLSHSSPDAISFVNSKPILLFGFGMYGAKEGNSGYDMKYEIKLGSDMVLEVNTHIDVGSADPPIQKIFFNADKTPISVPVDTEIGVCVKYQEYDDSSRLWVGTDGKSCDTIPGNIEGLFKVKSHSESQNGTGTDSGQIPELYYCLEQREKDKLKLDLKYL